MVTTLSVEPLDATWLEKMSTMGTSAPGKTSGSKLDLLDTLPERDSTETTMVVTQSRVELPLFPGQPLDQPLHKPHIQVTIMLIMLLNQHLHISHIQVREGIQKKNRFFLGKSPKLWVGGGQES